MALLQVWYQPGRETGLKQPQSEAFNRHGKKLVQNYSGPADPVTGLDKHKPDKNKINISVKRYGQKLVKNYSDLPVQTSTSPYFVNQYPGTFVIFEFNLTMEVFKLVAK